MSQQWISPKKYDSLSDSEKCNWYPAWENFKTETKQEMKYCDCCDNELGIEDVEYKTPIGEPYRYYQAGPLQRLYSKRLLETVDSHLVINSSLGSKIDFTRYSPLKTEGTRTDLLATGSKPVDGHLEAQS